MSDDLFIVGSHVITRRRDMWWKWKQESWPKAGSRKERESEASFRRKLRVFLNKRCVMPQKGQIEKAGNFRDNRLAAGWLNSSTLLVSRTWYPEIKLKHATFLSVRWKSEVNISQARTMVSQIFKLIVSIWEKIFNNLSVLG